MGDSKRESTHGILQFRGENFENWSFRVLLYLDSLNLLEAINNVQPAEPDLVESFVVKDKKAKATLISLIADEYLECVRDKSSAKEMWSALQETFAKKSITSQTLLRKQLALLRMKAGDDLRKHLLIFDEIIRKLKTSGAQLTENDIVAQLFVTLPDSFDPVVAALENMKETDLTIEIVKQRLLAEDAKRQDRFDSELTKTTAFSGEKKTNKFDGVCFRCKKKGHKQKDCRVRLEKNTRKANTASTSKLICFMTGDLIENRSKSVNFLKFKIDSGATDHMCKIKWCFSNLNNLKNPISISVAKDSENLMAHYSGRISGYVNDVFVNMKEVLYVPGLRDNLLSVSKLTANGIDIEFREKVAIFKKNNEVIMKAYKNGNLYEIKINVTQNAEANVAESSTLWHSRMGHVSDSCLQELVRHNMAVGINNFSPVGTCDTCIQGKKSRNSFSGSRPKTNRVLERIHSDICGPFETQTWDGYRYFASFIDDYSHFSYIYLLKNKSDVFERFVEYETIVTALHNVPLSMVTVDQGREYSSNETNQFFKSKGIQIQPSVAYTLQQNGVAERFNRTLVEKLRSLLIDAGASNYFWGEAALTATYLINRCPSKALDVRKTPSEIWYNKKPDVSKLRVFGCTAFVWVPQQKRKKLDSKSVKMVMMGYTSNGYRLWNLQKKQIVIARDIRFIETSFPFKETKEMSQSEILIVYQRNEQEGEIENVSVVSVNDNDKTLTC